MSLSVCASVRNVAIKNKFFNNKGGRKNLWNLCSCQENEINL
jgi:hypothetical protein